LFDGSPCTHGADNTTTASKQSVTDAEGSLHTCEMEEDENLPLENKWCFWFDKVGRGALFLPHVLLNSSMRRARRTSWEAERICIWSG
jgi:hypothetical protein